MSPIVKNHSIIENLTNFSKKLSNKYRSHSLKIKKDCSFVIESQVSFNHEVFDGNIKAIRELEKNSNLVIDTAETNDIRSYFISTGHIYNNVKNLNQTLRTDIAEKKLSVINKFNKSQKNRDNTIRKLANLIDFNNKINEIKLKLNESMNDAKSRLAGPLVFVNEIKKFNLKNSDKNLKFQRKNSVKKSYKNVSLVTKVF